MNLAQDNVAPVEIGIPSFIEPFAGVSATKSFEVLAHNDSELSGTTGIFEQLESASGLLLISGGKQLGGSPMVFLPDLDALDRTHCFLFGLKITLLPFACFRQARRNGEPPATPSLIFSWFKRSVSTHPRIVTNRDTIASKMGP